MGDDECKFRWVEVFDAAARGLIDVEQCATCGVPQGAPCPLNVAIGAANEEAE